MAKHKILVVDDFEMIRVLLRDALSAVGYENVQEAENGSDALDKLMNAHADGEPFDAVLCDWTMPEMNGLEFLTYCRKHEKYRKLPIIMVTAESERSDILDALRLGASDYLVKPISLEDLKEKLPKIFARVIK